MKNVKANLFNETSSPPHKDIASVRKSKTKNLSPAKKFKLRLRRAKFQKQQQAKEDYFEHDNRDSAKSSGAVLKEKKKKMGRLNKKGRRAQMYIDAYLKSQQLNQNGDTASQDETQDSSNGNDLAIKSIVQRATNIGFSSPMTSAQISNVFGGKEQAIHKARRLLSTTANPAKCCCHCACSVTKRKARRKLSSPYFGDFNRTMSLTNGSSCAKEAAEVTTKILNRTTTTMHETSVKAGAVNFINFKKSPDKMSHPMLARNYMLQGRRDIDSGVTEMRNVVRFVFSLLSSFVEIYL